MKKAIIVDGNSLLFRAFYATYAIDKENIMRNSEGIPTNAIFTFSNMILGILKELKEEDTIFVAFDAGGKTFRHQKYLDYKANRQPCPEELIIQMPIAREFLDALNIKHYEDVEIEADDIAGNYAKLAEKEGYKVEIYTSDRDYLQLINDNITIKLIKKGFKNIVDMTPTTFEDEYGFAPILILDYKGLRGDDSDNLKGIPGVGDITAKSLIIKYQTMENIIANADLKTKVGRNLVEFQEQGLLSKELATMRFDDLLPFSIEETIYKGCDFQRISRFASKYQFTRLLEKIPSSKYKKNELNKKLGFVEVENTNDINLTSSLGLAVETLDENYHRLNILQGLAFTTENEDIFYISSVNLKKDQKLLAHLANPKVKKYVFDYKKLYCIFNNENIKIEGLEFDLLLASYILDPASSKELANILSSYQIDINYALEDNLNLFDKSNALLTAITSYYSMFLSSTIITKLKETNQYELLTEVEQPLTICLADMEIEGFPICKETLLDFKKEYEERLKILTDQIYGLSGHEFNINSPKQLGIILFDELKLEENKKRSTSVEFLNYLAPKHPIIALILEYRKYAKLLSTYVEGFLPYIFNDDKIHATFNQALTTTGRLSSSEPNLQNISIRDQDGRQIRKAFFYQEPDLNILSLDYSQIELRILATLAGSKTLIDLFNTNQDIHAQTAKKVFHLNNEPSSRERSKAKAVNFGIVYGISDWGLSEQIGVPVQEAKEIITSFYEAFPEIRDYLQSLITKAEKDGYATTILNRRRYLEDLKSANYQLREFSKRAAMNAPIQGSSADLIKVAMIKVYEGLKEKGYEAKIISQIHDEIILKVNDKEKDEVLQFVKNIMENCLPLDVKLKVDGGYAKTWFDAK